MAGRELEELFRTWRSEPVPPLLPRAVAARTGSAVVATALRRLTAQQKQKRRARNLGTAVALAAVVMGLGIGTWFELRPEPVVANVSGSSVVVGDQQGEVTFTDRLGDPGSPLSQELPVERSRLLRGMGRTELVAHEVKRYSREFPQGYAVTVADDSLSEQP